jgi:hypothetical protein
VPPVTERVAAVPVGSIEGEDEERLLNAVNAWVVAQGLPEGELGHEIVDPESGRLIALLDLAWPEGLQAGLSDPVALLIDEGADTEEVANRAGFRFFTDAEDFRAYVRRQILAGEPAEAAE